MKRVTIKDIAEHAQVSRGTVDRVLHGRGKVAPDVEKAIRSAIKDLGYRPNIIARTLAQNRVYKISVLIPEPTQDPFWQFTVRGVERARAQVADYGVRIQPYYFDVRSPESYVSQVGQMMDEDSEGIVLAAEFYQESMSLLRLIEQRDIPTRLVNTELQSSVPFIGPNSFQAGRLAGQLFDMLIPQLDSQIAVVTLGPSSLNAHHIVSKVEGLSAYLGPDRAHQIIQLDIEEFENQNYVESAMRELLNSGNTPLGLFITNSRSYYAIPAIQNIRPPRPLNVIGFDLLTKNIEYLKSGDIDVLINQNPIQQAELAVLRLVDEIVFKKVDRRTTYLPMDVILRENVDFYNEDFR